MARKNLLESVLGDDNKEKPRKPSRADYGLKGASGQMKASLDTLAENAKKMVEGETIVEIDPELIDISFIKDRLAGDDEAFEDLKKTIQEHGQESPVLLRPHPKYPERYMIVFGHRRVRAARELDKSVRAVIKELSNLEHVISQGQENTARSDLSFIEKALFARKLLEEGYDKEVIQSALTIDATLLSRMLSVSQKIDVEIMEAIGPAKTVGRDRWETFKKVAILPANRKKVLARIKQQEFAKLESQKRFDDLLNLLQASRTKPSKINKADSKTKWVPENGNIAAVITKSKNKFALSLQSGEGVEFGQFLEGRIDQLYNDFKRSQKE